MSGASGAGAATASSHGCVLVLSVISTSSIIDRVSGCSKEEKAKRKPHVCHRMAQTFLAALRKQ
jgi:hypothetical protein